MNRRLVSVVSRTWQLLQLLLKLPTRGKVNSQVNLVSLREVFLPGGDAVAPRCHPRGLAMFLLIPCIVLLAQHGLAQNLQDKGEETGHGVSAPVQYRVNFSCVGRVAGYYADIGSGCQLYHMCDSEGRRFTNSCPNATLFHQRMMICDHWYMVNCNNSEHHYSANLLIGQRDKPFVGADEHIHHREPVSFFRIQQNPGSLQQPNWFPVFDDRKQQASADDDNAVLNNRAQPVPIPSVHISYKPPAGDEDNGSELKLQATSRQARYRNINTENRPKPRPTSSSPVLTTTARSVDRRRVVDIPSREISNNPAPSQTPHRGTLPDAYTNNPFLKSLTLRTQPTSPTDISNNFDSSRVQINATPHSVVDRKISEAKASAQLDAIANVRVSDPRALPQPTSSRRTKEFSIRLGNTEAQNLPTQFRDQKLPDAYTNNPFFQSLTKTRTLPVSTVTTPRSAASVSHRNNIGENEDDLNNIVELHLLDPRRMFFIPESDDDIAQTRNRDLGKGNSTVLFISLPTPSYNDRSSAHSVMHFRNDVKVLKGRNPECPRCHPGFLLPGRCQPCVIIR